jgi:hypothetical protein
MANLHYLSYGLRIASNLAIPGLLLQSKQETMDVQCNLNQEWVIRLASVQSIVGDPFTYISPNRNVQDHPNLRVATHSDGRYLGFFYGDGARFAVEREGREVWAEWADGYTLEDACTYLVGPVLAFVLRLRGVTCLHASAVAVDSRAIALFGVAGAGKSTAAAAFAQLGYPVLSDDVVALADRGDHFLVQPGYPRVNLWTDSVRALFGSEDALPRITPTWDKRYLALGQDGHRFQDVPLPLGAIYVLGERETNLNAPVIEELSGHEAFTTLVANTYVNYLLDRDMRTREFDVLGRVLAGLRVRRVRPTADPSKTLALCETIAADARQLAVRDSKSAALASD